MALWAQSKRNPPIRCDWARANSMASSLWWWINIFNWAKLKCILALGWKMETMCPNWCSECSENVQRQLWSCCSLSVATDTLCACSAFKFRARSQFQGIVLLFQGGVKLYTIDRLASIMFIIYLQTKRVFHFALSARPDYTFRLAIIQVITHI